MSSLRFFSRFLERLHRRFGMTAQDTHLIAGLGNPGKKYANTRHNIGFMAVENIGAQHGIGIDRSMFKTRFGRGSVAGRKVILARPMDYMNRSGPPLRQLARYFGIKTDRIIVVHDDLDIGRRKIRIKPKGGHGGHRGIKSIMDAFGTGEFTRIRLGIGRPEPTGPDGQGPDVTDFVLGTFTHGEMDDFHTMIDAAHEAVKIILEQDVTAAMNRLNQ